MKQIDTNRLSPTECIGIQINGLSHCAAINCKWQGLSACQGLEIIRTGKNAKGFEIGPLGLAEETTEIKTINKKSK